MLSDDVTNLRAHHCILSYNQAERNVQKRFHRGQVLPCSHAYQLPVLPKGDWIVDPRVFHSVIVQPLVEISILWQRLEFSSFLLVYKC